MTATTLFGWPGPGAGRGLATFEVLGVPSDFGNGIASGSRYAPAAIRAASIDMPCAATGVDHGDVGADRRGDWPDVLVAVERAAADVIARGGRPAVLGGDHAISYAAVAAARRHPVLNIVWFDAHTDYCRLPPEGWHNHKQVLRRIAALEHVGRIVQIGHRGMTYFDESAQFTRLSVIPARAAPALSPGELLAALPADQPVYLSIDIDVLDPLTAPGTGHPVPGGLSLACLTELACAVVAHRDVVGLDLMEVNPMLDVDGRTSRAGAAILASLASALCRDRRGCGEKAMDKGGAQTW